MVDLKRFGGQDEKGNMIHISLSFLGRTAPPGGRWRPAQRVLTSPRRRSRIGWCGFQLLSKSEAQSEGQGGPARALRAQPPPRPRPGLGRARLPFRLGGLLLLSPTGALAVNPSRGQDDNPTPRPAVQAEDGLPPKGFQAVSSAWRLGQRSGHPSPSHTRLKPVKKHAEQKMATEIQSQGA
ncbi:uncharacterized protein LOC116525435 [Sapajus apella]|uniref:Uncharacterized protein LOC116525435 n=1 Tax=Sapajus apella TaxID=9515 RepID=A0A6J3ESA7_SAPAP|nr:uncharacterized protein LOC116525435 [Sapajus apella]